MNHLKRSETCNGRCLYLKIIKKRQLLGKGIHISAHTSSRGTKKSQFRSYRRRKAKNAPKTKKSQRTALSRKKPVWALPNEKTPVSLVSDEKKPVCAVLGRKITTNDISRQIKNRNLLAKILLILL